MALELMPPLIDRLIDRNGVVIRVRTVGPAHAPAVVLMHGFPEIWLVWQRLVRPLLAAGWRVVLPDRRGADTSTKPAGDKNYTREIEVADVIAILDALELPAATLVGHDTGGTLAWWVAADRPDRVSKIVSVSAPHPDVQPTFHTTPRIPSGLQGLLFRDWPGANMHTLTWYRAKFLAARMESEVEKGSLPPELLAAHRDAWSREGGFDAMLGSFRNGSRAGLAGDIRAPALVVLGDRDPYVSATVSAASAAKSADGRTATLAGSGHYPHLDAPDALLDVLLSFIGRHEMIRERLRPPQW